MGKQEKIYDLRKLVVLIVDDSRFTAKVLQMILRGLQVWQTTVCSDPQQALDRIAEMQPDIVFVDIEMPEMDGIALTKLIRKSKSLAHRVMPIIAVSARTKRRDIAAARDAGVTEFLAKPIVARAVYTHLVRCIEAPRAFVETKEFLGPDRRRRAAPAAQLRRRADRAPTGAK